MAPVSRGRESWRLRLPALNRLFEYSLCHAIAVRERKVLEILLVALGDRPLRSRYARAHGLCLRHFAVIAGDERAAPAREVLRVRLGVLGWELEEAGWKGSWSFRHEARGDENTAWLFAPTLFDGRVFFGGPAWHQLAALKGWDGESDSLEPAPG